LEIFLIYTEDGSAIWDGEAVLYFGGRNGSEATDKILRYVPGTNETSQVGLLPFANRQSAAISHTPGEALIFGGYPEWKKIVEYRDKVASELEGQRLPKDTYFASATQYANSVFLFGGRCNKDIVKYDVFTGQSLLLNVTLPSPLQGSNSFLVEKYIYVLRGRDERHCNGDSTNVVSFNVESYEIEEIFLNGFHILLLFM
jgi:hypothetical protein